MFGTAVERVCKERSINSTGLTHEEFEITNSDEIKTAVEKYMPDVVINCIAIVGVNQCELEPQRAFDVNSIAVSNLAKVCEKNNVLLVQPSTHAVFDGAKDDYYTENDLPNPISVYSISKYAAECFAKNICRKHYIIRFPTLFGSRRNKSSGFVDKILVWIREGRDLLIADDKIDSPTYTRDAANTLISMLEQEKPFGVYHLANTGKVSYYDFVSRLVELLGTSTKVIRAKDKDFDALAHKPLKTAMKSVKLPPMRSWENALEEYISKELQY